MTRMPQKTRNQQKWQFRKMRPGEINVDPIEGEFFTTEAVGGMNDALVRESIQNSLDAAEGTGTVTVRFSLNGMKNWRAPKIITSARESPSRKSPASSTRGFVPLSLSRIRNCPHFWGMRKIRRIPMKID